MVNKIVFMFGLFITQAVFPFNPLQLNETQKLAKTAKIWGFLKYYHPQVAKGKFNWDEQLLELLPKVEKATNKEELSKIYLDWIESLGKVPICKKCAKEDDQEYFDKNFDLSWFNNAEFFTQQLSDKLKFIEQNRFQGKNHYVYSQYKQVGNITLKNEPEYKDLDWSNPDMRLLIAFKYWNIIEYFFPYKYQTDEPWDEVLLTTIPQLQSASTEKKFHEAIQKLVVKIDDSHGGFVTSEGSYYYYPNFKTQFIDGQLVVRGFYNDSIAQQSPIKKGDVILAVDNVPVQSMIKNNMDLVWGSNPASKYRNLSYNIIRSLSPTFKNISFQSKGEVLQYDAPLFSIKGILSKKVEKWKMLDDNIGYVNMGKLTGKDVEEMMESFKDTKAIIFDIRNYPKGAIYRLTSFLFPEERSFYRVIMPVLDYPGRFKWHDGTQCGSSKSKKEYTGKIVLLVNEVTQSRAEFNVMALQTANDVITLGSQTAGADGDVSRLDLGGGIKTSISGIGIFYPDGTETQRKGVKIDIEVHPTIQGIREGRDEVLEKAIELAGRP
ncbi:S41 family peptidase [Flagellimonas lutimaris]|uniref:S41 family peptidase n=1 Tax=Flagellimonas lutimaris TaxID=475082 RepID=UPI003F5CCEC1